MFIRSTIDVRALDDARYAYNQTARRDIFQHDGIRPDHRSCPDAYRTNYARAGMNDHTAFDMRPSDLRRSSAKNHVDANFAIVLNHRQSIYNNAQPTVVEEDADSDLGSTWNRGRKEDSRNHVHQA